MIDRKKLSDHPINNDFKTYEKVRKMLLGKEMIIQVVVSQIILTSEKIIK